MAGRWRVVAQREYDDLTPAMTFAPIIEVTYQLTSGTVGMVKVPKSQYSEEAVRALIESDATTRAAVEALEG